MNDKMTNPNRLPTKRVLRIPYSVCPATRRMRPPTAVLRSEKCRADNRQEQAQYQADYPARTAPVPSCYGIEKAAIFLDFWSNNRRIFFARMERGLPGRFSRIR